ncbi:L,D-transpeptidase [Streptomyces sp. DH12]|uniref:L,D-transpeptidase family protein n=1 Tax=Streptomyces sp. DH12 TaxID=2857010 RepID=UPI001E37B607|nr:L,D-transpeptidase family protein [Streptomyces sp. DH12]
MRPALVLAAVLLLWPAHSPARADAPPPAGPRPSAAPPAEAAEGAQFLTAEAPHARATSGTVTWWERRAGAWERAGSAPARFGAGGLVRGDRREQGTSTTPAGVYDLPFAFGNEAAPTGTTYPYRRVTPSSWWCQDNASRSYNRWVDPLPADCRAGEAEHLVSYGPVYAHALVIGFNYDRPVRGRGAGIFLHVNGAGPTAGCVSVPAEAMARILAWVRPEARPRIAIGWTGA